ncbi:hypothetical protein [Nocardia asiatica]|uniref:hypothetical protein n=1 Tax=Nocardia asiatica TaxID=209252 RepID=UPI002456C7C3|nr:hypothetical protein [Nocardia asiatica]
MKARFLYRVRITDFPAGALKVDPRDPDWMDPDPEWKPQGWAPDDDWIERFGRDTGGQFYWPSTDKVWFSRSSAAARKKLIESYGARAVVQRSSAITWPDDDIDEEAE